MEKLRVKPDSILGKWTPYLVLLMALILTVCATAYLAHSFQVKERERFQNEVQAVTNRLAERMDTYTELLRGARGLMVAANGRPSLSQFRAYTRSLELEQSFPGIQGIGFARRSDRDDLPHLVAEMRGLGFEKYNVRPPGPRPEYFPIVYLEPEGRRNLTALGFDMFSEPIRREAMARARDRDGPVLSGRVILVQEIDPVKQFGFLLYLPVYWKDRPTSTVEQRRAALLGFVYSPFRVDDLFQAILGPPENRNILVEVFDGGSTADDQVLYGSESRLRAPGGDRFQGTRQLVVAEHRWTLRFRTSPKFDRSTSTAVIPLAFTGGLAISALLFALTLTQSRQREQAVQVSEELWRTGEALREASRAKDEFLAMLGHELRNPLGAISNALQVMAVREITDPHLQHARAVIERQIRHQTRLIEDLLDVSRVNSGKISLRQEPVELKEVVNRAVDGLQWAVEEQQHRLSVQLPEEELWVKGDAVRLEQIVTNLLHNAIKYTPGKGEVVLTLHAEGDEAVLRVRDTGVGISAEMLERIFDVFTQAQISIDRSKGGLGLGLTLVRNLVRMHGGTVSAASAGIGRGSEFVIRLPGVCRRAREAPQPASPVSDQAAGAGAEAAVAASPGGGRRRILVVEDIKDARETLQELLELQGYDVEVAADGPEGLAKLLAEPPDVALIDIGLPGLSGYDVASRARAEGKAASVQLIALTGYGQPEDRTRALEAGFDLHVVKPIDPVELERLLRASWPNRSRDTECE